MTIGTSGRLIKQSIQFEPEMIEKLDRLAIARKTSRAAVIRECLDGVLSENDIGEEGAAREQKR